MSKNREIMVSGKKLSKIARERGFKDFIIFGGSYENDERNKNDDEKALEDVFEAFCAAIFLEFDEEILYKFLYDTLIKNCEKNLI